MLGYVAESGQFGMIAGLLFATQFAWQFPHFWSIAWKINTDYNRAGYFLLPTRKKDKLSSWLILLSSFLLIPISLLPFLYGVGGIGSAIAVALAGVVVFVYSLKLHASHDEKMASKLMFSTFLYLPIVQLAYLLSI
jgi:protoheme IX farnesyltransferase